MESGKYFLYNDVLYNSGKAIISADNRSFRFGDGFFETMKMIDGNIVLSNYHFERLFSSLQLLKFDKPDSFTAAYLSEQIKKTAAANNHSNLARIRLTIFRGDGTLYDYENNFPNYIIQTWQLHPEIPALNKNGLITGIYKKARKTCDDFSHIKTNNFLPYLMGALWAKENKFDEAIILNNYNRIADATIANVFLVKNGTIKTPALNEGCIGGVMRKHILNSLQKENMPYQETAIEPEELAEADEVFITNAAQGIKWVRQCEKYNYTCALARHLYAEFLIPIFAK